MKHLNTFKRFLNESMESENAKIRQELVKSKKIKDDDESRVNESIGFKVIDFPIGAEVYMGDEVWKVFKPGVRGEKIIMAPFNAEAKGKYISLPIEFDLKWLDGNVTKIDK